VLTVVVQKLKNFALPNVLVIPVIVAINQNLFLDILFLLGTIKPIYLITMSFHQKGVVLVKHVPAC